jgi:uncharacterized protein (DUF1330 family)
VIKTVYLVAELEVLDGDAYAEYSRRAPETVLRHGGRYLARGGPIQSPDGGWRADRMIIVEFPDDETLRAWQQSPEYREIAPLRERSTRGRAVILRGTRPDGSGA